MSIIGFLVRRDLSLADVRAADLQELLGTRQARGDELQASIRYGWSVLWLIREVASATEGEGSHVVAAAKELLDSEPYCFANAEGAALPDYLDPRSARRLIEHLQEPPSNWKTCRNNAAVALMLGAGLKPGEIERLRLSEIVSGTTAGPWKLSLEPRNLTIAHDAPMARWASRLLKRWLEARARLSITSELVFFSTAKGASWSQPNLILRCGEVLEAARVHSTRDGGGLYRLRHTFALRQLARGRSDLEVARWLGLTDVKAMARYRSVVLAPIDVA